MIMYIMNIHDDRFGVGAMVEGMMGAKRNPTLG